MGRYYWDNFTIGEKRAYAHCYRQAVSTSFSNWIKARKLDWEFRLDSDPKSPKAHERSLMVWVTRIEPGSRRAQGIEIGDSPIASIDGPAIKMRTGLELETPEIRPHMSHAKMRPVYIDIRDIPIPERMKVFTTYQDRTRMTQRGWERFSAGEFVIVGMRMTDIRSQILGACLKRDLAWRWEIRRVQNPDDPKDKKPCYLVTRLR